MADVWIRPLAGRTTEWELLKSRGCRFGKTKFDDVDGASREFNGESLVDIFSFSFSNFRVVGELESMGSANETRACEATGVGAARMDVDIASCWVGKEGSCCNGNETCGMLVAGVGGGGCGANDAPATCVALPNKMVSMSVGTRRAGPGGSSCSLCGGSKGSRDRS